MNSKSLRRLAGDHSSLHTAGLPPNYLFPPNTDSSADLTSLDVLLCGPVGTPYAHGLWRLHLDIPPTYPTAAPTAFFRTRCWHPNVDEATGAVCVETLKRDWSSTLKLRDVLVTISCLLIQPNPASALNEEAGKLANEDWAGFCRRARLMTEIHAAVPSALVKEASEAQMRGEERAEEPTEKEPQFQTRDVGKERVKSTPPVPSKVQRLPLVEDAENTRHRGPVEQSESDESDWVPGPTTRSTSKASGPKHERNMFGIHGLGPSSSLGDASKRILPTESHSGGMVATELEKTDSSITVTSGCKSHAQSSFVIPVSANAATSQHPAIDKVELHKFSHQNPFSGIQPNNRQHPLFTELSYTWRQSEVVHDIGFVKRTECRKGVGKRLASSNFVRRKEWELKRFKKAGCDLQRYNRGDFGPRTGIGRL